VSAALIESRGARAVSTSSQPPSVVKPTPWKPARQTGERRHAGRHRDVRPTRHNVEPSERHARTGWAASPETPRASILSSLGCRSPRRGLTPALLMRGPIRRRRRRGGPWSAARPGRGQPSNHVQLPQRSEGVEWPREDPGRSLGEHARRGSRPARSHQKPGTVPSARFPRCGDVDHRGCAGGLTRHGSCVAAALGVVPVPRGGRKFVTRLLNTPKVNVTHALARKKSTSQNGGNP
jgi:hypothetical protein